VSLCVSPLKNLENYWSEIDVRNMVGICPFGLEVGDS